MIDELTRRFDVPGFSLAWDVWGDAPGPPLVLCHGYTGSAHDFALHIEALAEHRRVYAIDHRGHGLSSNSDDPATYTVDHIVDDLVAWTSAIVAPDGQPFDLLGHSMGGRVAMRYAITRRDLVRSLILMDTTAWGFGPGQGPLYDTIIAYLEALPAGRRLPRRGRVPEDDLIDTVVPRDWIQRHDVLRSMTDTMAAQALGLALFRDGLNPIDHQLGDIDRPTTVICGSLDPPYIDHAPQLAASIPGAALTVIDGAFHSPQLTHGAEWRAAVAAHLDRLD